MCNECLDTPILTVYNILNLLFDGASALPPRIRRRLAFAPLAPSAVAAQFRHYEGINE